MSIIHFVGGEKGGVGKSVVSRLLSQYFADQKKTCHGLDADRSHPTLSRYYSESTQPLDLDAYESIDRIMDLATEKDCDILVDLPAQSQRFLDRWIEDNGVLELCNELSIPVFFWHLVDDGKDSVSLLERFLQKYKTRLNCVVVKNGGCGKDFSEIESLSNLIPEGENSPRVGQIFIPAMHESTIRKIDKHNLSFWAAANQKDGAAAHLTMMERQRTKVWLKKCYSAFDSALANVDSYPVLHETSEMY